MLYSNPPKPRRRLPDRLEGRRKGQCKEVLEAFLKIREADTEMSFVSALGNVAEPWAKIIFDAYWLSRRDIKNTPISTMYLRFTEDSRNKLLLAYRERENFMLWLQDYPDVKAIIDRVVRPGKWPREPK